MAEKTIDKQLDKIMRKTKLKGLFKKVVNLEECDIVLLIHINKLNREIFVPKKELKEKILPQPAVENYVLRYLKHTNPRYNNNNNKLPKRLIDSAYYK